MEIIVQALCENLLEIVTSVVLVGIGIAGTWLTAKIGKRTDMKTTAEATWEAKMAAEETVRDLQQTIVDGLKEASADGKLTPGEIKMLNTKLVSCTMANIGKPVMDVLNAAGVDIASLILSHGEKVIQQMHDEKKRFPQTIDLSDPKCESCKSDLSDSPNGVV